MIKITPTTLTVSSLSNKHSLKRVRETTAISLQQFLAEIIEFKTMLRQRRRQSQGLREPAGLHHSIILENIISLEDRRGDGSCPTQHALRVH